MLSNEDRLSVAFQVRQEFRGLAFQGSHNFSSHEVILKCHIAESKRRRIDEPAIRPTGVGGSVMGPG